MSRLAIIFLVFATVFGLLNSYKVKALRANVASTQATGAASPGHGQVAAKSNAGTAGAKQGKTAEGENRLAKAEAALAQAEKDKADLQAKLDSSQQEIVTLTTTRSGSE